MGSCWRNHGNPYIKFLFGVVPLNPAIISSRRFRAARHKFQLPSKEALVIGGKG